MEVSTLQVTFDIDANSTFKVSAYDALNKQRLLASTEVELEKRLPAGTENIWPIKVVTDKGSPFPYLMLQIIYTGT